MTDTVGTFLETKHPLTEAGPVMAPENDEVLGLDQPTPLRIDMTAGMRLERTQSLGLRFVSVGMKTGRKNPIPTDTIYRLNRPSTALVK